MAKFTVTKTLDLSFLGEGWQNTYLKFNGMTFAETREFAKLNPTTETEDGQHTADDSQLETVMNLLQKHFIGGQGYNGESIVPIEASDLPSLPTDVITKSIELL